MISVFYVDEKVCWLICSPHTIELRAGSRLLRIFFANFMVECLLCQYLMFIWCIFVTSVYVSLEVITVSHSTILSAFLELKIDYTFRPYFYVKICIFSTHSFSFCHWPSWASSSFFFLSFFLNRRHLRSYSMKCGLKSRKESSFFF